MFTYWFNFFLHIKALSWTESTLLACLSELLKTSRCCSVDWRSFCSASAASCSAADRNLACKVLWRTLKVWFAAIMLSWVLYFWKLPLFLGSVRRCQRTAWSFRFAWQLRREQSSWSIAGSRSSRGSRDSVLAWLGQPWWLSQTPSICWRPQIQDAVLPRSAADLGTGSISTISRSGWPAFVDRRSAMS